MKDRATAAAASAAAIGEIVMNDASADGTNTNNHAKSECGDTASALSQSTSGIAKRRKDLDAYMLLEFHKLSLKISHIVKSYAERAEIGSSDCEALLIFWQARILGESLTASDIAARLNLTRAGTTYLLDRLESKGYIIRERDPHDRRKTRLRLSEAGCGVGNDFAGSGHCLYGVTSGDLHSSISGADATAKKVDAETVGTKVAGTKDDGTEANGTKAGSTEADGTEAVGTEADGIKTAADATPGCLFFPHRSHEEVELFISMLREIVEALPSTSTTSSATASPAKLIDKTNQ